MSQAGRQAPYQDGTPVVASTTERDARFPTPDTHQRVFNRGTGNVERYDGSAWVTDVTGSGGTVREFNVRTYGAKGDGTTDDTAAILAAIAAAAAAMYGGVVFFPPGSYVVSSTLQDGAVPFAWVMSGPNRTYLRWNGASGGTVVQTNNERCQILGGCTINAKTVGLQNNFIGIINAASRGYFEDVYLVQPDIGVQISGKYGNKYPGLDIQQGGSRGIDLLNGANANQFWCKQVTGSSLAGSRGLSIVDSVGNLIDGNQLSQWETNEYQSGTSANNDIRGFFNESATTASVNIAGGSIAHRTTALTQRIVVGSGAVLLTDTGKGMAPGIGYQPATRVPMRGLTAYYPMQDGAGVILRDYSGNNRHATLSNPSWVTTAPYGYGVQLDGTGAIAYPTSAITYNAAWSVAILCRVTTFGSLTRPFNLSDGTNSIGFALTDQTRNLVVNRNGSFAGNLAVPYYTTSDWVWVLASYDGSATMTVRHPAQIGQGATGATVACANPLTSLTSATSHGSLSGTVTYGAIAIWNREVAADEFLDWVTQHSPQIPVVMAQGFSGTLTLSAAATSVITDKAVTASSFISLTPFNAAAATLMNSTKSLYVSARTAGTSFTLATADGTNAAGTETFLYRIVG